MYEVLGEYLTAALSSLIYRDRCICMEIHTFYYDIRFLEAGYLLLHLARTDSFGGPCLRKVQTLSL